MTIVFLFLALILGASAFADEANQDNQALAESGSRTVEILAQSTFKIEAPGSIGTGFLLAHPLKNHPGTAKILLVTAAHVLDAAKGDTAILHLRRKKADGSFEKLRHPLPIRRVKKGAAITAGSQPPLEPLWTSHPEEDVAIMVASISRDSNFVGIEPLATTLLATDEILEGLDVRTGDELFALGFPFGMQANAAGFPIVRSGHIASFPIVPTRSTKTFLVDLTVFGGASGGPVLLYDQNRTYGGKTHFGWVRSVLGVVSEELVRPSGTQYERKLHQLQVAKVVHAVFVRELVEILFPDDPIPFAKIE